ncbi:MAG: hypothetical protein R6V10_12590 [bacterium]
MARACYICGGPVPEKVKGSFCSRECFETYKQRKQKSASSGNASPASAPPASAARQEEAAIDHRDTRESKKAGKEESSVPSFAHAAGRCAYRLESESYLGIVVSERQRSTASGHKVEEWTLKAPLGNTVHVPKDRARIGEPPDRPETDPLQEGQSRILLRSPRLRMMRDAPLRIKLLGGAYIYIGALGLWAGLFGLVFLLSFSGLWEKDQGVYPPELAWLKLLAVLLVILSALAMAGGYKLFRLRAWARAALEIVGWTAVAAGIIATGYAMIASQVLAASGLVKAVLFFNVMFAALMWLVPFLALLHFLREPETRRAARH